MLQHIPTGVDLTREQWNIAITNVRIKNLFPLWILPIKVLAMMDGDACHHSSCGGAGIDGICTLIHFQTCHFMV